MTFYKPILRLSQSQLNPNSDEYFWYALGKMTILTFVRERIIWSAQLTVFHNLLQVIFALVVINCFLFRLSLLFFVKFRSMKEASIAVAVANKCQRISVSYANILPGWKRTPFIAINVVFAGKLLLIGVDIQL